MITGGSNKDSFPAISDGPGMHRHHRQGQVNTGQLRRACQQLRNQQHELKLISADYRYHTVCKIPPLNCCAQVFQNGCRKPGNEIHKLAWKNLLIRNISKFIFPES